MPGRCGGTGSIFFPSAGGNLPLFLFAALCVLIQASVEGLESRAFVFGKMHGEGVSLAPAVIVSALVFLIGRRRMKKKAQTP